MTEAEIQQRLEAARAASRELRAATEDAKNFALLRVAELLEKREGEILTANSEDLASLEGPRSTPAFRDRLALDPSRVEAMAESLRQVARLPDPVGELVEKKRLENGLEVRRVRSPLGVIFMIFESRPNVAIEAFSLGFKAGNVMILRGGSESTRTTAVLYAILRDALKQIGLAEECVWGIADPDRRLVESLLKRKDMIDVVVPRGGESLIDFVTATSRIPVIKHDRGLCHVYVHEDADLDMAERIVVNSKCQRPGTCNAMETVLAHDKIAPALLPRLHAAMSKSGVEWFADERARAILAGKDKVSAASDESWDTEYLDFKVSCRVVASLDEAIRHIERHGSRHSESIVTRSSAAARRFESEIDAAAVYWNASTRFTDGFELGLGGELGISTQKLHVRGPVGLRELTSVRWVIEGNGQIRS